MVVRMSWDPEISSPRLYTSSAMDWLCYMGKVSFLHLQIHTGRVVCVRLCAKHRESREGEDWLACYYFVIYLKKSHNRAGTQESKQSAVQDLWFPEAASGWLPLGLCILRAWQSQALHFSDLAPGTPFLRSALPQLAS